MKSNALLKTLGFLALAATPVVAGTAPAPKNPIAPCPNDDLGINASLGYDSSYVWRGVNFGSNWVSAGLNGDILLVGGAGEDGAGSTSLLWDVNWGFLAGDNDAFTPAFAGIGVPFNDSNSFQRLQMAASFAHDFGPATVSLGYRYFLNMGDLADQKVWNGPTVFGNSYHGMNDTQEVFLGVNTSVGPIDLASSANYDMTNGGWYFDLTASTTVAITDSISFVPSFNVGYVASYSWQFTPDAANSFLGGAGGIFGSGVAESGGDSISGWTAANIRLAFPIKLNSRATLTPYVAVNMPMGALSNVAQSSQSNAALAGVGINPPSTGFETVWYAGAALTIRF
ncbi:hypothetical protein [Prosthecobacter sp.]|uniref:hypothetical protein n=1 Tax=Prosthecobacter sp. TaxID=1965333 RepID=UPI001D51DD12|nr:hypothetical protein [Prosthecobacter sp.]MCB1278183.1 hypothetical protein [Prosthecobacter sp.]